MDIQKLKRDLVLCIREGLLFEDELNPEELKIYKEQLVAEENAKAAVNKLKSNGVMFICPHTN